MNAAKFERKARALIAEVNALLPHLAPAEVRVLGRCIAAAQAITADLPKEKSSQAERALTAMWELAKLIGVAHAPMIGLGDEAGDVIAATVPAAVREAGNIQAVLAKLVAPALIERPTAGLLSEAEGGQ